MEKKFKTKTGYCHILPDKIVLTRDGIIGDVSKIVVGNRTKGILIIYGGLSLAFLYFAFDSYQEGGIFKLVAFSLFAVYLIYGILTSLNNSATPVIERHKIKNVKLKKSIPGLTRSRFEVNFEDDDGRTRKRLIMLPGNLAGGKGETEIAIQIMKEENLL